MNMPRFFRSKEYLNIKDLIIYMIFFIVALAITAAISSVVSKSNDLIMCLSYIINFTLMIVGIIVYRKIRVGNNKSLSVLLGELKKIPSPALSLWSLLLLLSLNVVLEPLLGIYTESFDKYLELFSNFGILMIICSVFVAPIVEELIFRAIIYKDISNTYGIITAIVASSVFFGIIHFNVAQSINAFFIAVLLCYSYIISKTILLPIFLHFINNALSVILISNFGAEFLKRPLSSFFNNTTYLVLYAISVVFILVMILHIFKIAKNSSNN